MEQIVFLNGTSGYEDIIGVEKLQRNFNCILFDDLYEKPEKLVALKFLKPEYLYINTTGLFRDKINSLVDYFLIAEFLPKGVIFGSENSVMALLGLARDLKEKGVKFYYYYDDLEEISWI